MSFFFLANRGRNSCNLNLLKQTSIQQSSSILKKNNELEYTRVLHQFYRNFTRLRFYTHYQECLMS